MKVRLLQIGLCAWILFTVASIAHTRGWKERDALEQCNDTVTEARYQRIDAHLRGFLEDDRH